MASKVLERIIVELPSKQAKKAKLAEAPTRDSGSSGSPAVSKQSATKLAEAQYTWGLR
jgi:hypothetical protein